MSEGKIIGKEELTAAILTLFDEGFLGAVGKGSWYIDSEPGSGFFGSIASLDAAAASRPLTPGDPLSVASHVDHVRFSLNLANRAGRGENPYPTANWAASWELRSVDEGQWKALQAALKKEVDDFRGLLASGRPLEDAEFATGSLGLLCHTAWHLGAVRQGLSLVAAPKAKA